MDKQYFVLEFAHSMEGRVKRIAVSYKSIAVLSCCVVVLSLGAFALVSSYVRMSWRVANYNELRADFDRLRGRYQELQRVSRQHNEQMASLETLASEVTVAYGLKGPEGPSRAVTTLKAASLTPSVKESIEEYNYLRTASLGGMYSRYALQWQTHTHPSLWPMIGILRSSFGARSDPFSGEGAFHTGIDISAPQGTDVHATADGVVASAGWVNGYGRLLVLDHGNNLQTYYAHLSRFLVIPGEAVRGSQVIALSGASGRATGPHIHYEVRLGGTPVNPYKYLDRHVGKDQVVTSASTRSVSNELGL